MFLPNNRSPTLNHRRHCPRTQRASLEHQSIEGMSPQSTVRLLLRAVAPTTGASSSPYWALKRAPVESRPTGGRLVTVLAGALGVVLAASCASTPSSNVETQPTDTTTATTSVPPAPTTSATTPAQTSAQPPA